VEAYGKRSPLQRTWDVIEAVEEVAAELEVPMARVALAWVRDRPAVSAVILGARTTEQLRSNLDAADLRLSDKQVLRLDEASDPGVGDYPYGVQGRHQRSRKIEGGR
jgi:aryl-alcohol dehydrogenase-like predicted oxidoreductase